MFVLANFSQLKKSRFLSIKGRFPKEVKRKKTILVISDIYIAQRDYNMPQENEKEIVHE